MSIKLIGAGLAGILLGLTFLIDGARRLAKEIRSKKWLCLQGFVLSSKIKREELGRNQAHYVPILEYEYKYNGETFVAREQIDVLGGERGSIRTSNKFLIGSALKVYINPKNPTESCLKIGCSLQSVIFLAVGFLTMVVSVALLIFGI